MSKGKVLVAIVNQKRDWQLLREKAWYRIPVSSVERWLQDCWPPTWLAFYQTKVFGNEAYAVNYYGRVLRIQETTRLELLPEDTPKNHLKANRAYFKLSIDHLRPLPQPIFSRRLRRIVFIPTTIEKFRHAVEINDLWDESPLEDRLWALLKQHQIRAERQYPLEIGRQHYFLDFAIFCNKGNIDIETDGDTWHAQREQIAVDNERDNNLVGRGWRVLRFNTAQINENPVTYCLSKVMETVNRLEGFDDATGALPRFNPDDPEGPRQLSLFD